MLGGTCTCTLEGRSFALQPGCLYIMPQYVPYAMIHDPADPFFVLWQHIRLRDSSTGPHMICRRVERGSAVWHILSALTEISRGMLVEQADMRSDPVAREISYLEEALLEVLNTKRPLLEMLDPRLAECIRLVTEEPGKMFTVQSLADHVQLERSYFSRLFQSELQISAQTFLIRHRLGRAAEALLQGCRVCEAAELAGYSDSKAFSRAFSGQYGITPAQYRKYHVLQP